MSYNREEERFYNVNTSDNRRPVIQLSLNWEFIAEFDSCTSASRQFGGKNSDKRAIYDAAKHKYKSKGYRWQFKELK